MIEPQKLEPLYAEVNEVAIPHVLGLEHDWRIAIVGFGYLCHAFATFITPRKERFKVAAIFEDSPAAAGGEWRGIPEPDASELENVLPGKSCDIGILGVPAEAAQAQGERLASSGIGAIHNFAPVSLQFRAPVIVRNIDLAGEMSIPAHRLSFSQGLL